MEQLRFRLTILFIKVYNWYLRLKGTSLDETIDDSSVEARNAKMAEYGFKPADS